MRRKNKGSIVLLALVLAVHGHTARADGYEHMLGDDDGFGTGLPVGPGDQVTPSGAPDGDSTDEAIHSGDDPRDFVFTYPTYSSITACSLFVQYIDWPETQDGFLWIDDHKTFEFPRVPVDQQPPYTVLGATIDLMPYVDYLRDGQVIFNFLGEHTDSYRIDYIILTIQETGVPLQRTLTVSSTTGGTASTPGIGSFGYDSGTSVPLVAEPGPNYHFVNWTGTAVDAGKVADASSATTTVTVDGDYTLQANFSIDQHTLTISATAGGTVISPGEGAFTYDHGEVVILRAEPNPLFQFLGWRGSVFASGNPVSITMDSDRTIKARFESILEALYVNDDSASDPGPGDPNVSDPQENGTAEHPFDSVQEAIDVAKPRARIIVRPGTYFETIDLLGKSIEVNGLNADDPNIAPLPVIDGEGKNTVVTCTHREDPNCVLCGFELTGGRGWLSGGVLCVSSSPTIMNCLIVGNRALALDAGGGIYCRDSNAAFVNCTISGNCGGSAGAGVCFSDSNAVVVDSIVWENAPAEILASDLDDSVLAHTDVTGGWPGDSILDVDPCFVQPGYWADPVDITRIVPATYSWAVWVRGDYHLLSQASRWDPLVESWLIDEISSPCIDAGDPNSPVGEEPVSDGGTVNLGTYGGTSQASLSADSS